MSLIEKRTILDSGKTLYVYNDLKEYAVRLKFDGKQMDAYIKFPWGEEVQTDYDAPHSGFEDDIYGYAYVFGDVMTKKEYDNFPEGFELDKLSLMRIKAHRRRK